MDKKYLLFDLDGTLTDPKEGITKSVAYALKTYGIEITDLDSLTKFIGPPLIDSFMRFYGFSHEQAVDAVAQYRVYFAEKGIFENDVYPGIKDMLAALKAEGKVLTVATSKPEPYARQILAHFGLDKYFDHICGATMDETRTDKAEVIAYALETAGVTDKAQAVMVGDRKHDIIGAKKNGLEAVGVLFGYGSPAELTDAGADHIAATVDELKELLI